MVFVSDAQRKKEPLTMLKKNVSANLTHMKIKIKFAKTVIFIELASFAILNRLKCAKFATSKNIFNKIQKMESAFVKKVTPQETIINVLDVVYQVAKIAIKPKFATNV